MISANHNKVEEFNQSLNAYTPYCFCIVKPLLFTLKTLVKEIFFFIDLFLYTYIVGNWLFIKV